MERANKKLPNVVYIFLLLKMKVKLSNLLVYFKMPRSKAVSVVPVKNSTVPTLKNSNAVEEWPPQHKQPSLFRTLQEGFAFGTGSSLARNFVDRVFPINQTSHEPCVQEKVALDKCILAQEGEVFCGESQKALIKCLNSQLMK